jgi:hypothetical protein
MAYWKAGRNRVRIDASATTTRTAAYPARRILAGLPGTPSSDGVLQLAAWSKRSGPRAVTHRRLVRSELLNHLTPPTKDASAPLSKKVSLAVLIPACTTSCFVSRVVVRIPVGANGSAGYVYD